MIRFAWLQPAPRPRSPPPCWRPSPSSWWSPAPGWSTSTTSTSPPAQPRHLRVRLDSLPGTATADAICSASWSSRARLLGMFWGAPLVARELETGTFRLAWTQGVTRNRWLAVKLAVAGLASMAVTGLLSLMLTWWFSPIDRVQRTCSPVDFGSARHRAGRLRRVRLRPRGHRRGLLRRTIPAMAVTLAVFAAVVLAFPVWVRPYLLPPAQTTVPLSATSINGFEQVRDGRMQVLTVSAAPPGAWVLSIQLTTPSAQSPPFRTPGPACRTRHRSRRAVRTSRACTCGRL